MSAKRRKRELRKGAHLDTKVHPSQVPLQVIATVGKAMEVVKAMVEAAVREGIIALVVAVVINIVVQAMTKRNGKETKMYINRRMGMRKKNHIKTRMKIKIKNCIRKRNYTRTLKRKSLLMNYIQKMVKSSVKRD